MNTLAAKTQRIPPTRISQDGFQQLLHNQIRQGVYWLVEDEVNALAAMLERGESLPDYSGRIPHRKAKWRAQLKAIPPAMLPEKSRWASLIPWAKKVAREYGILAVMATGVATRRIKDEQMITVDGGAGPITILSG